MKKIITFLTCIGLAISMCVFQSDTIMAKSNEKGKVTDIVWQYDAEVGAVYYGFKISNTNKSRALADATVKVTVRDADNKVLSSDTQYIQYVGPKDSVYMGWSTSCNGTPEKVEVKVKNAKWTNGSGTKKWDDVLVTSNIAEVGDEYSYKVTGDIENKSKESCMPIVSCVLKQEGQVVAVYSQYLEELEGKDSTTFEIYAFASPQLVPAHDAVECHTFATV